ncbi:MAG: hypothetical protein EOO52_18610 [Gammaproteobacteria bacterium]|nr:MAG: hypothetical protein EOO52_18610 [Gammaproteobacteria bacterium]
MNIKRIFKHTLRTQWYLRKYFTTAALESIEKEIAQSETQHSGEIRFVVEGALDGAPLFKDQSAHERALDIFSQLRIWDTQNNNGLLIYLLLADHAVEIIADRGINAKVDKNEWQTICRSMQSKFAQGNFHEGVVQAIRSVTKHLVEHFPVSAHDENELPNKPVVL